MGSGSKSFGMGHGVNAYSSVCAPLIGGSTIRTQRHGRRWAESKNLRLFQNDLDRLSGMVGERNAHLLGIVNHAVNAGLGDDEITRSILERCGTPPLSEYEIERALEKARGERGESNGRRAHTPWRRRPTVPAVKPKRGIVRALIDEGDGGLEGLMSLSPVPLPEGDGDDERRQRALAFLSRLYLPGDLLYVGGLTDTAVKARTEREAFLGSTPPDLWPEYMGSNPFNGPRRKANVAAHRFAVVESDPIPLEDQARFWCAVARRKALPVAAVTYSGNKSLHALLRLDAPTLAEFDRYWVRLSARFASPLDPPGERFDDSCKNPDRMTRLPEARNRGTGKLQRLLYLA